MASGAIPYLSPTGMRQSVLWNPGLFDIRGTPLGIGGTNRLRHHFSFLESTSEHFESTPSWEDAATAWENYPNYKKASGIANGEETRVITDPRVYEPFRAGQDASDEALLTEATVPQVQEIPAGRKFTFKMFGRRVSWWVWRRTYYRLAGWESNHEMDYAYRSVLSDGRAYPDSSCGRPVTGVGLPGSARAFALRSVAPNPSHGTTHLQFDLPAHGKVGIMIFDVSGRLVRSLQVTGGPGVLDATWDGLSAAGNPAASGIYFARSRFEPPGGRGQSVLGRIIVVR